MKINLIFEYNRFKGFGSKVAFGNNKSALEMAKMNFCVNRIRGDIIHTHSIGPLSALHLMNIARKKPFVYSYHITPYEAKHIKFGRPIKKIAETFVKKSDVILHHSPFTKKFVKDKPCSVISNGVNVKKFAPDKKKRKLYREKFGLEGTVVYSVGMPIQKKGVFDFIKMADKFSDVKFVWFGTLFPHLKTEYNLSDLTKKHPNVLFTGFVDDISAAHNAGDIMLFPSYHEILGIPILEAGSCRKPVIVRNIECYPWLDRSVKFSSLDDMKKKLKSLIENKELQKKNGMKMHKTAKKHDIPVLAKAYRKFYTLVHARQYDELEYINTFE